MKRPKIKMIIILLALMLLLGACSNERKSFAIAEQYGLAYAPVTIMKEKGYLKEDLPDVEIEWRQMANTTAIREAMIAGDLDMGFMALPPFLIGADKGMKWKIVTGLSEVPLALISLDEDIQSLSDFDESDRIALPQPGSIQHILLSMAAERELGEARHFDNMIVTMTHPDGMNALLANIDIAGHFTSPPYLYMELENPKAHVILTGEEAMGEKFTFAVGVSTDEFSLKNPLWETAFKSALSEAISYIEEEPREASAILSQVYGLDQEIIYEYITNEEMIYTTSIKGMKKIHDFMEKEDYIDKLGQIDKLVRGEDQ